MINIIVGGSAMNRTSVVAIICITSLASQPAVAQAPLPILDMHMHARTAAHYGPPPQTMCAPVATMPTWDQRKPVGEGFASAGRGCVVTLTSPVTDAALLQQTLAAMQRYNVVGVLGGRPELVANWMAAAPGRFIPGLDFRLDRATGTMMGTDVSKPYQPISPDSMRRVHARGALAVLGEVTNMFGGIAPEDPRMAPYWALAEELDIPVGIHLGPGAPGEVYFGNTKYRARFQSALTLEEMLIRHPRLRVYIMHGGYPFLDDLLAVLFTYPQVYLELSMVANVETRASYYRYLRTIVEAGYGERVMFGSDFMLWPGLIDAAVAAINEAPFLNETQKRNIFYDNAARFLRLTPEQIAQHHAGPLR